MKKLGRRVVELVIITPINERYAHCNSITFGVNGWANRRLLKAAVKKMPVRIAGFNADSFVWDHAYLLTKSSEE